MQTNFFRKIIFDEKSRSLLIQTLVIGLFALFIYLITQQTAYNLEKRGISSGFDFLHISAGYDISIRLIPFTSEDTHLKSLFCRIIKYIDDCCLWVFFSNHNWIFSRNYSPIKQLAIS